MSEKEMHFTCPQELFEDFHRLFPRRGDKTSFFLEVMSITVERGSPRRTYIQELLEDLEDE